MNLELTGRYSKGLKKRLTQRNQIQDLCENLRSGRAGVDPRGNALLTMVLEQGITFEQIARLRGEYPSTVIRRFQQLLRRSRAGDFAKAVAATKRFDPLETAILIEYYVRGASQKDIVSKLNTTNYRVRKTIRRLTGQIRQTHPTSNTH